MTSALKATGSTHRWRRIRQAAINSWGPNPTCWRCGHPITGTIHAGHTIDRALGGDDTHLAPEHPDCSRISGASLGGRIITGIKHPTPPTALTCIDAPVFGGTPHPGQPPLSRVYRPDMPESVGETPGADDPCWEQAGWLQDLLEPPEGATWPRLMSPPHPRAVGSYGAEWADWATGWDVTPRWWQRLVATRVLEHDADGLLVWPQWVVSTSRQSGKSILLRLLAMWRLGQGDRFGGPQLVMHTGKDIPVCRQVQRPARAWARRREGWWAREANGREEVGAPDDSRWLVRAQDAVYGYTVDLGLVDEAWDVRVTVVEEGLEPTMPERLSPQLGLLSTAHRRTTDLLPGRRRLALTGQDVLLVEWSADPGAAVDDRAAWRAASPHWSPGRERLLEQTLARVGAGSGPPDLDEPDPMEAFRCQWLNVWPGGGVVSRSADEPLLAEGVWPSLGDLAVSAAGPLLIGVEDWFGLGAAAAACGELPDGRPLLWGRTFGRRDDAFGWAADLAASHGGSRLLAGASLAHDQEATTVPVDGVTGAGSSETRTGLALLRDWALAGDLVHDGGAELAAQVGAARVRRGPVGLVLTGRSGRSDLLRCVCWVLAARAAEPPARRPGWVMV